MNITFVKDVDGVCHRFDRFTSYVFNDNDLYYRAFYEQRDGSVKVAKIDITDWQDAETRSAPLVPCAPGYSVILVAEDEQGKLVPWASEIVAWRRQDGYVLPCCFFWKHDEYYLCGLMPTVMFPDGHVETPWGHCWPSLEAYMAEQTDPDPETKGPPFGEDLAIEGTTEDESEGAEVPPDDTIH